MLGQWGGGLGVGKSSENKQSKTAGGGLLFFMGTPMQYIEISE